MSLSVGLTKLIYKNYMILLLLNYILLILGYGLQFQRLHLANILNLYYCAIYTHIKSLH